MVNCSRRGRPKGHKLSDETKRKISESVSGEKHPQYGKPRPEDVKARISEKMMGIERSEETRKKMSESKRLKRGARLYKEMLVTYTDEESRKFLAENKDKILECVGILSEKSVGVSGLLLVDLDIENTIYASCDIKGDVKLDN